jgi:hypothetical protein
VGKVSGSRTTIGPRVRADDHAAAAGDRLPSLRIARAEAEWLSDLTRHRGFTLLAALAAETPTPALAAFLDKVGSRYSRCLEVRSLPAAPADLTAPNTAAQLYLVRPDGYIALRCDESETAKLETWLRSTLL